MKYLKCYMTVYLKTLVRNFFPFAACHMVQLVRQLLVMKSIGAGN